MDATELQRGLVDRLVEAGRLRDGRVADAFRAVPRHHFLPGVELAEAYRDVAVPTKWDGDGRPISSSSQPAIMAAMLAQLDVRPGDRVLEIGAGTGWNAALLAHLAGPAGSVTTVDLDQDIVAAARDHLRAAGVTGVEAVRGDGALGWPAGAPYDRAAAGRDPGLGRRRPPHVRRPPHPRLPARHRPRRRHPGRHRPHPLPAGPALSPGPVGSSYFGS